MDKKSRKITRGISEDFAQAFKESSLFKLYKLNSKDLIIGIRNNYINIYYNCDSIAKVKYRKKDKSLKCSIGSFYLGGTHEKNNNLTPDYIVENYETIKMNSDLRQAPEKKAQSSLVIKNNNSSKSNWFCVDIEYVKSFSNKNEKESEGFNGRFDIIAVSKSCPHRVALIELKYGNKSLDGDSGIYKHISDFDKFSKKDYFNSHLKAEIPDIISSLNAIGDGAPIGKIDESDLLSPEFFIVTLDNNPLSSKKSAPMQSMAGYLFKEKRWNCKKLSTSKNCVEEKFGDVIKKSNKICVTFLFSRMTNANLNITDIIDGEYDERIIPS